MLRVECTSGEPGGLVSPAAVCRSADLFVIKIIHDGGMPLRDPLIRCLIIHEPAVILLSDFRRLLFKCFESVSACIAMELSV